MTTKNGGSINGQSGFTLLELLIAMTLISMSLSCRARAYFDQYSSKKNLCTIIITPAGFFKFI
ncbi:prepilin-type N-terminal cleavage/methylation domain-containing protein, partial [Xenorhabdus bovienii]|uniref:prepilin-type N-terminal cleavage/methylation domain-containing protein n=1 Tax=Xenorhabdus bovienii TaxID=40576 RepID=UPI00237C9FAE